MANSTTAQETRERVLQLAREIEELSQASIPPQNFFRQFLDLLVRALGAPAGAVWSLAQGGRMNLIAEIGLAETGFQANPQAGGLNQKLLSEVISTGQACTHSPDESDVPLPTPHLNILAALYANKECVGVVQVFQRADAPREARPGYLQFVEQMTGYASRFLERQRESKTGGITPQFWDEFEQFVLQLQHSLDVDEVTSTAVNDGRLLLGCDRLSIAVKKGKKISIQAVSGEDRVNPRSNLVRAMTSMARKVMEMRERVTYVGKVDHLAPQIEEPLANFIQEGGSRMVIAVPLFASDPLVKTGDDDENRKQVADRGKPIGCVLVEQVNESQPQPGMTDRLDLLVDHTAAALHNAKTHQRLFLLRFWQFLGGCLEWFHGRKLAKTLAAVAIVAAVTCALVFIPYPYRVEGKGRLMPVTQREVFAQWDGEVVEIFVEGGQTVKKDQKLVQLRNDELQAELVNVRNQLNEKQQLWLALRAQFDAAARQADRNEAIQLQGKIEETKIEIEGLQVHRKLLEDRIDKLTVKSPIDGVVATFQVDQLLRNRPVRRGEVLLDVMDDQGDWRLELQVEEHRMGHILHGQEELRKAAERRLGKELTQAQMNQAEQLPVEFILATKTESTFYGKTQEFGTRSQPSQELGNVVEVFSSIDNLEKLPNRRIGAEVRAKIDCGNRSLGYVLLGDVIEFVRQRFWL